MFWEVGEIQSQAIHKFPEKLLQGWIESCVPEKMIPDYVSIFILQVPNALEFYIWFLLYNIYSVPGLAEKTRNAETEWTVDYYICTHTTANLMILPCKSVSFTPTIESKRESETRIQNLTRKRGKQMLKSILKICSNKVCLPKSLYISSREWKHYCKEEI